MDPQRCGDGRWGSPPLTPTLCHAFSVLSVAYQDRVLRDWFMGNAVPADGAMRELVRRIHEAMLA